MHFYDDWARRILAGQGNGHLAFYGLPGYAYLLAAIYRVFGFSPFLPAMFQSLLDAGTAVLIYKISVHLFRSFDVRLRQTTGILAAAGWAFFVPAETYAVILMPTALAVFVFWFLIWQLVRQATAPRFLWSLLAGLLTGVTATVVATMLFLVPLLAGAILLKPLAERASAWRNRLAVLCALVLGLCAGTAPCWTYNAFVARDPVFLSAHSGINLWIGNNPEATGYPKFPPGLHASQSAMLQDSIDVAEAAAGHPLKRGEVSQFWSSKAHTFVRENFIAWLKLLGVKVRNFWSAFQYDDLSIVTTLRDQHVTLPGIYFGFASALAIPGLILSWLYAPASRWVAVGILLQMASLLSVFVTERYRLAAAPGLLIFAALGLAYFWRSIVDRHYWGASTYGGLLVGSIFFISMPLNDPTLWALDYYNSGLQALDNNQLDLARRKLNAAYAYSPENAEVNFAQGNLHFTEGDNETAKHFYRVTLSLDPHHGGASNNLGVIALEERQWRAAETLFRRALQQSSVDPKAHYLLARACLGAGDFSAATAEIEEATRLDPTRSEFLQLRDQLLRR
ncbi:MAG: tetratricopeptide repeat protein [Verrucomicrobiota bacterium]|nr:tetratricopeptide repeat protein [Verrucomicrobiota bacterium]